MINSSEPISHIVRSLVDAFSTIRKKYFSKDPNVARHVLSQSTMNKSTRALQILMPTSKLVGLDIKTLCRYWYRREQCGSGQTYVWAFIGRLSCSDMNLIDAVKGLV